MMDFKKLKVWEKSHELVIDLYKMSKTFPKEEMYGITSQLRRSALSITNNIAEGCGRNSKSELNRFITISLGSACEVENLLIVCKDLDYVNESKYIKLNNRLTEIKKMMSSYSVKIEISRNTNV